MATSTATLPQQADSEAIRPARLPSFSLLLWLLIVWLIFRTVAYGKAASEGVIDPDIWWHLANARDLFATHHFLQTDHFTYTVGGKPWINFEWLGELPYYFAYKGFGNVGLFWVMMVTIAAITAGVQYLCWLRSHNNLTSFAGTICGMMLATVSFGPRTLLFGWLFLVVELIILRKFEQGRDYTLWLPPLFLFWINTHGSWLIGFGILVVFFGGGLFDADWNLIYARPWTKRERKRLLWAAGISLGLLFVNPYGWRLVEYPFDVALHQRETIEHVAEWATLNFHDERGKVALLLFIGIGILKLTGKRRLSLQDVLICCLAVYSACCYSRFLFLAGIVLAPELSISLSDTLFPPSTKSKSRDVLNLFAMAAILLMMIAHAPRQKMLQEGLDGYFPTKAMQYLGSLPAGSRLYNEQIWGGYIEWFQPKRLVFDDSRNDIFVHTGIFNDALKIIRPDDTYALLDKYNIQYVLILKSTPLSYLLAHGRGWKETYDDGHAVVYARTRSSS